MDGASVYTEEPDRAGPEFRPASATYKQYLVSTASMWPRMRYTEEPDPAGPEFRPASATY